MRIYSTNAASRFDIGIQANGGSNLDIKANNLYIDAETALAAQDDNCNVAITAKNAVFTGGIQTYGNSSVKFLKDDSLGRQQLNITVDGQVVNIPSYAVKPGQLIGVRERSKSLEVIANSLAGFNHSKYAWLEWDEASKVGKLLHIPERADIPENIKEHLIVELYSK